MDKLGGTAGSNQKCLDKCSKFGAAIASVSVVGSSQDSPVSGYLVMTQASPEGPVTITGEITGLAAGPHGFHIHEIGSTDDGCVAAGGHFNPFALTHGGPDDVTRHVGDLGNIFTADGESATSIDIVDEVITLFEGTEGIIGRTLVIHAGEDDLGDGGTPDSGTTGNAGSRVGCGIVELRARPMFTLSCTDLCSDDFKGPVASINVVGSSEDSPVNGNLLMIQVNAESRVFVRGEINGLQPGPHGFHIHEIGSTDDGCVAAGGHFNPLNRTHGGPDDPVRHVGDLGNIFTPEGESSTPVDIVDDIITLFDATENIVGRTLVIHDGEDDLGDGGTPDSGTTGNAGSRVACGIVQAASSAQEAMASFYDDIDERG